MQGITRFGLDTTRVTLVFMTLVLVGGLAQFLTFPRLEDPAITIREVVVSAQFPGMEPEDIEQLITREIEAELRGMREIDDIWSESKTGTAIIHANTRDEVEDVNQVWQTVRNRMADLAPKLPAGTIGPFVNDEFGLVAVATIALWADGFDMGEMRDVSREIRDRIYEVEGVRKVELWGTHEERVFLEFSSTKLGQVGISIQDIMRSLIQQNVVLPGGRYDVAGQDFIIEPSGNFRSVEDIENVVIQVPGTQRSIILADLMQVRRGFADPPENIAYFNGQRAIVVSVSITTGVNAVDFGERLTTKVKDLESKLPLGYVLEYATFQPELVEKAVNGALTNVYQTLVIVLVVVVAFLGLRTGLIVGSFVPMTMLLGLIIMRFFGIELERVSIASAIIALGMLVDNGIVIAEEIGIRLESGQDRRQACLETAGALAVPLLTSSLTTILAFVPMLLMTGQTGEYSYSLPMVVTILLLSSWFLSMYQTPFMSYYFMKVKPNANKSGAEQGGIAGSYRKLLKWLLSSRKLVVLATIGVFLFGGFLGSQLVREMFGHSNRNQFLVYLDLPAGSNINATDDVVRRLGTWLADDAVNPEVASTIAYVGTGGPRFVLVLAPFDPDPNRGFLIVNTETSAQVPEVAERVRKHILDSLPEAEGRVKQMWSNGDDPGLVEIRLIGPDADYLAAKGTELTDRVRAFAGISDIRNNWENKVVKVPVRVDQTRARRAGISSQDVSNSLQAHVDGIRATDYREGDQAIPVILQAAPEERSVGSDFYNVRVYSSADGHDVPLTQIADISGEWELSRVARHNQERALTVEFKHERFKAPELLAAVMPDIDALELGDEYRFEVGGELETAADTMPKLFRWLPHCAFLAVVLLIWQFNSFRRPLIIVLTLPMAFVGSFIGLVLMGAPFDFFGILGLLSLAGIIINNGIVLIDRIDVVRKAGSDAYSAIVEATVSRFRPICMTTITTILGVMPLIISHDPVFYSMAIIIGSGLAFGTLLTLGVVPILYAIFFRVQEEPAAA